MLVVTVRFELASGALDAFRGAILRNAAASLEEPGCRRFDVAFSQDGGRCFLYELYDHQAAFDYHHDTPHFREFGRTTGGLVADKKVETFLLEPNPLAQRAPRA